MHATWKGKRSRALDRAVCFLAYAATFSSRLNSRNQQFSFWAKMEIWN